MVSELNSISSGPGLVEPDRKIPGSRPGQCNCVVFLGKCEVNAGGNSPMV